MDYVPPKHRTTYENILAALSAEGKPMFAGAVAAELGKSGASQVTRQLEELRAAGCVVYAVGAGYEPSPNYMHVVFARDACKVLTVFYRRFPGPGHDDLARFHRRERQRIDNLLEMMGSGSRPITVRDGMAE